MAGFPSRQILNGCVQISEIHNHPHDRSQGAGRLFDSCSGPAHRRGRDVKEAVQNGDLSGDGMLNLPIEQRAVFPSANRRAQIGSGPHSLLFGTH